MVTREGQVKVMDFGIARVTTTVETIAQTAAVLGTAAYLSPEQAKGERVDRRSDLYSLGCVLYELLTGAPPFAGDSAMAVAMKHVQQSPRIPSEKNRDITPQMDAVVMKALAKNPDNRYQTAGELREDLERLRRGEAVSATPILSASNPTQVIHRHPAAEEPTATLPPGEEEGGRRWWVVALVVLAILAVLGGLAWALASSLLDAGGRVTMPDLSGLTLQEANARLRQAGIESVPNVRPGHEAGAEPNTVIDQDPPAFDRVAPDVEVTLTVEEQQRALRVPDVEGLDEDDAEATLEDDPYNYDVTSIQRRFNPLVDRGFAIGTEPEAGTELAPGSSIILIISRGERASPTPTVSPTPTPTTVAVPDVVCRSVPSAQNQISAAGLTSSVVGSQPNEDCPNTNKVAAQAPAGRTEVAEGTTVKLWTSEPESTSSPSA